MQKYRAAAAGDTRGTIVIDLDDKIVEMILAPEPVAAAVAIQPHGLIVVPTPGIFAPDIFGPDRAHRQERTRPWVAVGAPPQSPGPERAFRRSPIAFALVGPDATAPKGDRDYLSLCSQPAPAGIAGGGVNPDRGKRPITRTWLVSD
jgi:hypothetical protein